MEPTVNCCTSHSQNSDSRGFRWGLCLILIIGFSSLLFGHTAHGASTTAKFCVNKSQMVLATTKTGGCGKGETKITWSSKSKARVCITRNKTLKYAKTGTCPKGSTRASLRNINGSLVTCVKPSTRQLVWKSTVTCPKSYVASPLDLQVAETTTTSDVPTTIVTSGNSETTTSLPYSSTTITPATSSTTTVPSGTSSTSSSSTTTSPSTTTTTSPPLTTTSSTTIPVTTTTMAVTTSTSTSTTTTTTTTTTVPATTTTTAAPEPSSITYFFTGNPTINEGSTTYLWAYYSGVTATVDNGIGAMPNALAIDVTPNVTTTYTLTVSNGAGHTSTATVTITVIPAGGTTTTTSPPTTTTTTVPTGTTTTTTTTSTTTTTAPPGPSSITHFLTGTPTINEGDSTYLWAYYSGVTATVDNGIGAMPNALSVTISPTVTTTYTLTVSNGAGHTSTATVTITVIPAGGTTTTTSPPTTTTTTVPTGTTTTTTTTTIPGDGNSVSIRTQPLDTTVLLGDSKTFSVNATAAGTLTYQWYRNDVVISGANLDQYTTNLAGSYKVDVTSTLNGSTRTITSNAAVLTLRAATISAVSPDTYVTQGRNVAIAASISSSAGITVTYQWKLDGTAIPNSNSIGILASQGGDYTVTVTSARNNMTVSQTSAAIHLTVVPAPTITSFDSLTQTIAFGGSTELVPVFSNGTAVINPGNISVVSGEHVRVSPNTTTTYTLTVSNVAGTQGGMSYEVTVTTGVFADISNAMSTKRWFGSTSIGLSDGRVLIYGNEDASGTRVVDIFNPITNTFSRAGDLGLARREAPGVLLANGKVLVAGGTTYITRYQSVNAPEIYDPTTNSWTWTGSMSTSRRNHAMIRLANGKVLVIGGEDTDGNLLQSAEIYDPTTGLFTNVAAMPEARSDALVSLLPNGNVIVIGGYGGTGSGTLTSAIVYNPVTNTWSSISSQMQIGHGQGAALVTLADGRIMIAGGWVNSGGSSFGASQTDIFDPTTGQFSHGAGLTLQRGDLTGHLLNDGKVVFIGGSDGSNVANSVDVYDPTTNRMIRQFNTMFHTRYKHSSALLPDGRVLIIGGNYWAANTGEIFTE